MIRHSLADAIFWIAAVLCMIAQIAILRSALVAPITQPVDDSLPRQRRNVEVAWTFVPALALALLLLFTWRAIHSGRVSSPETPATPALTAAGT